jgi:hypothetical protein
MKGERVTLERGTQFVVDDKGRINREGGFSRAARIGGHDCPGLLPGRALGRVDASSMNVERGT